MTDQALMEELRDMGEHPSRADLPMGRTLRDAADRIKALREALISMRQAAAGFALAVRNDSGVPYPWPALDIADAQAEAALQETER